MTERKYLKDNGCEVFRTSEKHDIRGLGTEMHTQQDK